MTEFLRKLIATFVVAQYKFHSIHTDSMGAIFLDFHPLMDEIYSFFGDGNIDMLKERVRVLGECTPTSLAELIPMSKIRELKGPAPDISEALNIVLSDLEDVHSMITAGYKESANDLETQQLLIDLGLKIGVFEYKLKSVIKRK